VKCRLCFWKAPYHQCPTAAAWKVTDVTGAGVLYLGGSVHALRPSDYPLPPAYMRAFNASARLAFEIDPKDSVAEAKDLLRAGQYPKGDTLKNHVDPRTYDYLRRFFAARNVPEQKFARFRPWLINVLLAAPPPGYFNLGVERFIIAQARLSSRSMSGLESVKEHNQVFEDLTDHQSEIILLLFFINMGQKNAGGANMLELWRRGDVDALAQRMRDAYHDFSGFYDRVVTSRNLKWLPKLESYLHKGQTYFVIVGAAHMGGPDGLVSLLQARGYHIEQL
jgi:uncharacterized protein YbaP (TraB family)